MKKKLLITSAALALSLTALSPTTSFANMKSVSDIKVENLGYEDAVTQAIYSATAIALGSYLFYDHNNMWNKINSHPQKLGYLKGDQIRVPVKSYIPLDETTSDINGEKAKVAGFATLTQFYPHGDYELDPSIKVWYDRQKEEVVIEKIKNIRSTGKMTMVAHVSTNYTAWKMNNNWWEKLGNRYISDIGYTYDSVLFTNFKDAPTLNVDSKTNVSEFNLYGGKIDSFYTVKTSAGKVTSKWEKEPKIGEQTISIQVWDEYGEENKTDKNHNIALKNIKINAFDQTTFSNKDLIKWDLFPLDKYEIIHDPNNSLTDNTTLYSNKDISAIKKYNLEPGANYKFTALIKPEKQNEKDIVSLSLKADNGPKRELSTSYVSKLKTIDKEFKELITTFTAKDGERIANLSFDLDLFNDTGAYIDSFKLEKVK